VAYSFVLLSGKREVFRKRAKDERTQKRKKAETPITKDNTSWTSRLFPVSGSIIFSSQHESVLFFIARDDDGYSQRQMLRVVVRDANARLRLFRIKLWRLTS
jgi:hypothetical protein